MNLRKRNKLKASKSKFSGPMRYMVYQITEPDGKVIKSSLLRITNITVQTGLEYKVPPQKVEITIDCGKEINNE